MKVFSASLPPLLIDTINAFGLRGKVWLVGGAVRDHFLQQEVSDFDFAVDGDAVGLARQFADDLNAGFYILDRSRGTARVIEQEDGHQLRTYDFSRLRGPDIEADLLSRDFTINSMGFDVMAMDDLLDPCDGIQDLLDSKLRACSKNSISDDPIRTIRAIRLAARFELQITPDTVELVREEIPRLIEISPERKRDELFEVLKDPRPDQTMRLFDHFGISQQVFASAEESDDIEPPSITHSSIRVLGSAIDLATILSNHKDPDVVANSTLGLAITQLGRFRQSINRYLNRYLGYDHRIFQLFYLSTLLASPPGDIHGKSALTDREIALHIQHAKRAERVSRILRLSNLEVEWITKCLYSQIQFGESRRAPSDTPRDIYRYYRTSGEAGVAGILLFLARLIGAEASPPDQGIWAVQLESSARYLSAYFETPNNDLSPEPFLKGDDLIAILGMESGPEIGLLLEFMLEAQVSREVNSREEAIELVKEKVHSTRSKT